MRCSRALLLLFCSRVLAFGALTVSLEPGYPTQTTAVFAVTGFTGGCTWEVSKSNTYSPVVDDVDATVHSGANVDTSRSDTFTRSSGTVRVVTIGHNVNRRALATDTTYYYRVSGCGETFTGTFTTPTIALGTNQEWPVPFDASQWGNRAYGIKPQDLLNPNLLTTDPVTGVEMHLGSTPNHWTMMDPPTWVNPNPFVFVDTPTSWTNGATIANGASSTASTTGTDPIDLYPTAQLYFGSLYFEWSLNDFGVYFYGSGANFSPCIFLHPTDDCIGTPLAITNPNGSGMGQISGGGFGGAFPNTFPKAFFDGWGSNVFVPIENRPTYGTAAIVSGVITIDGTYPTNTAHFSTGMKARDRIYLNPSGPSGTCQVGWYTLAHADSAIQATLTDATINCPTGTPWTAMGFGVRIRKTGPGTLNLGAGYRMAGANNVNNPGGAAGAVAGCNALTFASGDGLQARWCVANASSTGTFFFYFLMSDGSARPQAADAIPDRSYFTGTLGWNAADAPHASRFQGYYYCSTSTSTAREMYCSGATDDGTNLFWKLHYDGDATENADYNYTMTAGEGNSILFPPSNHVTWSLITSHASPMVSRILSAFPTYNAALYGTNFELAGISGDTVYFMNRYGGPQDLPEWVALFDLPSGTVTNLIHSIDGTGTNGKMRHGGVHNLTASPGVPNTASLTVHGLNTSRTDLLHAGPYQSRITHVMRSGAWSTDTTLDCPTGVSSAYCGALGNPPYDDMCPSGNPYESMGATGHMCATYSMPDWCNVSPRSVSSITWTHTAPDGYPSRSLYLSAGGSAFVGSGSHTFTIQALAPDGNGKSTFQWQKDGGSWNGPVEITGTGDIVLSDNQSIRWPWQTNGDTLGDQWVVTIAASKENDLLPCPSSPIISGWNTAAYSHPTTMKVGDLITDPAANHSSDQFGSTESQRIISIVPAGAVNGENKVVVQRAVEWTNYCSNYGSQMQHANGWIPHASAGINNACSTPIFIVNGQTESSQVFLDMPSSLIGHGDLTQGTTAGMATMLTTASATQEKPIANVFDQPITMNNYAAPTFHGTTLPVGSGGTQAYVSSPGGVPWLLDDNSINGGAGGARENTWAVASANPRDLTHITGNIYTIEVYGTVDPRIYPLTGYAGAFLLKDVSGPTSDITAIPYGMCIPLASNECYPGSTVGAVGSHGLKLAYLNLPMAWDRPDHLIVNGQHYANQPAVFSGWPGVGAMRQRQWTVNDASASQSRMLTYGMDIPGDQYAFQYLEAIGTTQAYVPVSFQQGWGQVFWTAKLPSWYSGVGVAQDFVPTPITIPAGPPYAEVEFGYDRFLGPGVDPTQPNALRCMPRAESCNTSGSPYAFASQAKTLSASYATGGTINIPAMASNSIKYRINRSTDGITWTQGDIQSLGVSGVVTGICSDLKYSATSGSISASGATGTITIAVTNQSCVSNHTPGPSWFTLTAASAGCALSSGQATCTGNGSVTWSASANAGSARTATLVSDSGTASFTLTQSGAIVSCTFSILPVSYSYVASGGVQSIAITVSDQSCGWTASSAAGWLSFDSTSGTGSATIHATAAANSGAARSSSFTIAGQTFAVSQAGTISCTFSISPLSNTYSAAGASQAISIIASDSICAWAASSPVGWLTLDTTSGTGSSTVQLTASPNSGSSRSALASIAGQTFSATQAAAAPQSGISLSPRIAVTPGIRIQ